MQGAASVPLPPALLRNPLPRSCPLTMPVHPHTHTCWPESQPPTQLPGSAHLVLAASTPCLVLPGHAQPPRCGPRPGCEAGPGLLGALQQAEVLSWGSPGPYPWAALSPSPSLPDLTKRANPMSTFSAAARLLRGAWHLKNSPASRPLGAGAPASWPLHQGQHVPLSGPSPCHAPSWGSPCEPTSARAVLTAPASSAHRPFSRFLYSRGQLPWH